MCNLYRLNARRSEIAAYLRANDDAFSAVEMEKDYVSPSREGWVARNGDAGRVLDRMHWGFPHWQAGQKDVVNVRNYTSSFWRSAITNPDRRCLVPFTSFQEWSVEPDPVTKKKRPYWFSVPSRPIAAFAGIWRPTETGPRFAFLTCGYDGDPANHVVGAIHPKACPVVLHDEDFDRWLSAPLDDVLGLACAYPSQLMALD
ncbi:SOS response-associated peptidase family protein [Sphingomonas sp. HITSZ_GF]|uniref:SOS response-associated peptidase n=1 Tax=Sphingomonas sp. HITSZ_GF TaxID=3037247 RepID=UPI00240D2886|nr:SOS response-associated peptidase family protein [Sphingomonas sp. HITSZ_GF]MDG2532092.1 SOS response-associated peptidase family protein [Sphingomonas sp. HITSZ_GF]